MGDLLWIAPVHLLIIYGSPFVRFTFRFYAEEIGGKGVAKRIKNTISKLLPICCNSSRVQTYPQRIQDESNSNICTVS